MKPRQFIDPAAPKLGTSSPTSADWSHEIKFDGYRLQVHKTASSVQLLSRNGTDLTDRFASVATHLAGIAAKDCLIDAEIVALDDQGRCDFQALHRRKKGVALCVWAFDLLALNGTDYRAQPMIARRVRLQRLVAKSGIACLRYSQTFDDPVRLLAAAEEMGLEGIVSKRKSAPYVSGSRSGWIKVKTKAWKVANARRSRMFERA